MQIVISWNVVSSCTCIFVTFFWFIRTFLVFLTYNIEKNWKKSKYVLKSSETYENVLQNNGCVNYVNCFLKKSIVEKYEEFYQKNIKKIILLIFFIFTIEFYIIL